MKFTLSWLKEYLDTKASLQKITETLTAIGLEVEGVSDRSEELKPFTVAEIVEADKHPNADKLKLCKVNNGKEMLQIVCGAANARAGLKVVLASIGSVIPTNGMKIKPTEIRAVKSNGMLCSASELGVGGDSEGIIELPEGAKIGAPFASVLGLDDPVIEIAITPNRGDCLGVYGIARDLAAAGIGKLKPLKKQTAKENFKSPISVSIKDTKKAPMFIGRYIRGVKNTESPDWLKQRLEAIGLRPISALVDITNYLTFSFGRPAHVYDADTLSGNIVVRDAKAGEKIETLDDKTYTLEKGMAVIADNKEAIAIGGIIGGSKTGCTEKTRNVFLEIALFNPINVAQAGRKLQIESDARYRFERSVDSEFMQQGAEIATRMILDLCGGEAGNLVIAGKKPAAKKPVNLRPQRIKELTGVSLNKKQIIDILQILGFKTSSNTSGIKVAIPSWRKDIEQEVDLIEEVVRINGYDKIPISSLTADKNMYPGLTKQQRNISDVKRDLATRGMKEVITFSFMDSKYSALFGSKNIALQNPISSDLGSMRPSILPNLLSAVAKNEARGFGDVGLFEVGPVFSEATPEGQQIVASGLRSGRSVIKNHFKTDRDTDVFDVKADAIAAISYYLSPSSLQVKAEAPGYYHPGKSGSLVLGNNVLGYFGEMHPNVLKKMNVKNKAFGFEVFLDKTPAPKDKKTYPRPKLELSNYQSVLRDFSFIVDEKVTAEEITRAITKSDRELIESVNIFDVYTGEGVEKGKKSIAISVKLQPKDHTLTDVEIEKVAEAVIQSVKNGVGGVIRY